MSKELIVATGRHETRVAILEDDQLVEVFHEREKEYSLAGSIHKGRVTRVLPGMQSAFVDIGLERDAFLYVSDFFEDNDEYDAVVSTAEDKVLKLDRSSASATPPEIAQDSPAGFAPSAPAPPQEHRAQAQAPRHGSRPDSRPDSRPPDQNRDHGDRGGRGRRGRRRGGRAPGGIPDSKYFTPGADRHSSPAPVESRTATTESGESSSGSGEVPRSRHESHVSEGDASRHYATPEVFERFTLPGESLAKYTGGTTAEIEPAIPVDHHLAGLTWSAAASVAPAVEEATAAIQQPEAEAEEQTPEPQLIPTPEAPQEAFTAEDEEIILAAAEAVAAIKEEALDELATGVPGSEIEAEAEAEESEADEIEGIEVSGETASGEEGPEPARTPTSLTAQLREQGHKYPHRASRRSRRRGGRNRGERGDQGGEPRGPRPAGDGQPTAESGLATAASPDEPAIEEMMMPVEGLPGDAVVIEEKSLPATLPAREERKPDRGRDRDRGGRGRDRENRGREASKEREAAERPERERPVMPSISDLLKEGQEIIVQISKEPLGTKGARITSHIALPGRFVVYMPTVDHAGVSRKIPSDEERQRLKRVLQTHRQGIPGGYICRTAAEGKTEEELKHDMHFLYNLWLDMRQKAEKKPAPVLLHHDLDLVQRILRDQLTTSFKTIWVDNEEHYESILRFVERFQPGLMGRVKLYTRANPIFDEFGITAELEKALRPKVWLKSGGYIVINQTEALVAIDINTGKYVGKSNRLEDTIVKINTDAVKEIVRQIRLRDLGGIVVVDFIDMDERKNRQKVMMALEDAMRVDRAPYKILQFNDFGLVAITRKRVKQSLERTLCTPCSYCEGAGYIKSPQTVITEILSEAQRLRKAVADQPGNLMLRVNPEVAKVLKSNHNSFLQEVEEILGKSVMVKSDPLLHQTKFDLA
jgi:ribonuclease G